MNAPAAASTGLAAETGAPELSVRLPDVISVAPALAVTPDVPATVPTASAAPSVTARLPTLAARVPIELPDAFSAKAPLPPVRSRLVAVIVPAACANAPVLERPRTPLLEA